MWLPALPWTIDSNRAAVHFHNLSDDRQPQAQAAKPASGGAIFLPKILKHMRQKLWIDAFACVNHPNLRLLIELLQFNHHFSTVGCEFNGIGEQIPHDLLQPGSIPETRAISVAKFRLI